MSQETAVDRIRPAADMRELQAAIMAMFEAGWKRHFTVGILGGLDPSPARDRIEALYDGHIATGRSDDEAHDAIVDLLQTELKAARGA